MSQYIFKRLWQGAIAIIGALLIDQVKHVQEGGSRRSAVHGEGDRP